MEKEFLLLTKELVATTKAVHKELCALRVVVCSLMQTHPDPDELLLDVMDRMDLLAPEIKSAQGLAEQAEALAPYLKLLRSLQSP